MVNVINLACTCDDADLPVQLRVLVIASFLCTMYRHLVTASLVQHSFTVVSFARRNVYSVIADLYDRYVYIDRFSTYLWAFWRRFTEPTEFCRSIWPVK